MSESLVAGFSHYPSDAPPSLPPQNQHLLRIICRRAVVLRQINPPLLIMLDFSRLDAP